MNIILAPMQGMTMAYYRTFHNEIFGGVDDYYAPFISTTNKESSSPSLFKDLLPESNTSVNVIPQLLGKNGSDFRYYASKIVEMGYKEINWNIGCPFHTVTKKTKGSGILPHPDLIKAFLDEVCKDTTYDLTIKMRLGLHHLDEGIKVVDLINDYPLKGVIIHGRTGDQKYTGTVDLDAFEVLYKASKHEVTYNGDIFTFDDYAKVRDRFPDIQNYMLGRGALRDPFLPSILKGNDIPAEQKMDKIREFHEAVFNHYKKKLSGDRHVCDKMKEFWMYMSFNIDPNGKHIKKIRKSRSLGAYLDACNQMLNSTDTWT